MTLDFCLCFSYIQGIHISLEYMGSVNIWVSHLVDKLKSQGSQCSDSLEGNSFGHKDTEAKQGKIGI